MNIILSLNPTWANKIYDGEKIIEFRKTIPKTLLRVANFYRPQELKIYIYETGKIGGITGFCRFKNFIFTKLNFDENGKIIKPEKAAFDTEAYKECIIYGGGMISEEQLYKYSLPKRNLYMWRITDPNRFRQKISIELFGMKKPPQSWCYTNMNV